MSTLVSVSLFSCAVSFMIVSPLYALHPDEKKDVSIAHKAGAKTIKDRAVLFAQGLGYSSITLTSAFFIAKALKDSYDTYYKPMADLESAFAAMGVGPEERAALSPEDIQGIADKIAVSNDRIIFISTAFVLCSAIAYINYAFKVPQKAINSFKAALQTAKPAEGKPLVKDTQSHPTGNTDIRAVTAP